MLMFFHRGPSVFLSPNSITVGYKSLHNGSPKPVLEGGKLQTSFSSELPAEGELSIREMRKTLSKTGSGNVLSFSSRVSQGFLIWGVSEGMPYHLMSV